MINVAIIGATGYTAIESIQILLRHPQARLTYLTALPEECGRAADVFPVLRGRLDLAIEPVDWNTLPRVADVALCCLPHKVSMQFVPRLLSAGLKVVDFSADYRFHDVAVYERVYQVEHTDRANASRAVFGLPELFRERIPGASLVANPGCYPTAAALALAPLVRENLIDPTDIVVNAVSGASGAGRKAALAFHFPEMNENLFAYAVGSHRHLPEIEQIASDVAGTPVNVLFQPHVVSMDRGIFESIYCRPSREVAPQRLQELFQAAYASEPFVRVLAGPPRTKSVSYTNYCDIYPTVAKDRIVVFSAIDNLIKGAAGQAIQNLNLICGVPETAGLL
ncbi:MAG: N-acetyl-gamma-glutamyl-phosphate reductase [Sedimentisphaerales bacterium]|nr:N-acetyl-gamma-glutamyl-phosphate reductase [Sedimentisphaerales bacterium]